jgi:hypothetical protein
MCVVDMEVYSAACISEVFRHGRQMQDLIIASVLAEVGAANHPIANLKLNERFRDFQTAANEGGKDFVGQRLGASFFIIRTNVDNPKSPSPKSRMPSVTISTFTVHRRHTLQVHRQTPRG